MTTPTINILGGASTSTTAQTHTTASITPTAGRKVFVAAKSVRQNHTTAFTWSISNSGDPETWTDEANTGLVGTLFAAEGNLWSTDAWSGGKTITIDPFATTDLANHFSIVVFEIANYNGFEQAIIADVVATDSLTLTFGSTPTAGTLQLGVFLGGIASGTVTWDAPPTDFTEVSGGTNIAARGPSESIESTDNTATGVTHGYNAGAAARDLAGFLIEFAEAPGGLVVPKPSTPTKAIIAR